MKLDLELVHYYPNINSDDKTERIYLNFWNHTNGNDITAQIIGDKIFLWNEEDNEFSKEIPLSEYISLSIKSNNEV